MFQTLSSGGYRQNKDEIYGLTRIWLRWSFRDELVEGILFRGLNREVVCELWKPEILVQKVRRFHSFSIVVLFGLAAKGFLKILSAYTVSVLYWKLIYFSVGRYKKGGKTWKVQKVGTPLSVRDGKHRCFNNCTAPAAEKAGHMHGNGSSAYIIPHGFRHIFECSRAFGSVKIARCFHFL